jgi:uncharacterized membrane protein
MDEPQLPVTSDGRMWAYVSYLSPIVGIPLFLVPILQRNDDFALYHAKNAAMIYVLGFVIVMAVMITSVLTCGVTSFCFPLAFLTYIPLIHGFILVSNDERKEPFGLFGLPDLLLKKLQVDEKP